MTVRMSTCTELAQSREAVATLSKLYKDLENSAAPLSLLLPSWFPKAVAARNLKQSATNQLCDILSGYVDVRRQADIPRSSDAMDYLIAQGSSNQEIVDVGLSLCGYVSSAHFLSLAVRPQLPLWRGHQHRHDWYVSICLF